MVWAEAIFGEGVVPLWRRCLPFGLMLGLGAWAIALDMPLAWRASQAAALLLVAVGLYRSLAGRAGDLVEARRRSRVVFASGVGLWIGVTTLAGALGGLAIPSVGGVLALALAAALLRLRVEGNAELAPAQPPSVGRVIAPAGETDEERGLHRRLRALMQEERAYREGGLTVGILAARLGVPEYRLRRLINQRLGHRNFTSFANGYRLAEAMAALADPAQARVPVLTIALDAGFQSIGPFNRAFKAHTGQTPSEFRRAQLARQPAAG
jgi:AraC-like DNA-binding protein